MLAHDWPYLHAAVNDLPTALLPVAVLFDAAGIGLKRDSLRVVGFWTLLVGTLGTAAAVAAGLEAEQVVQHSEEAHEIMERHQTMGLVVLGIFVILTLWRVWRRSARHPREELAALAVALVGLALLVRTAQLGGSLVFDHALGVPTARLHVIEDQRGAEAHEHGTAGTGGHELPAHGDGAAPRADSAPPRRDSGGRAHD